MKSTAVPVAEIIRSLEGEAANTDTDPRWRAAKCLREISGWESRQVFCRLPQEATGTRWIPVSERLPEPDVPVLAHITNSHGKTRRLRARWIAKHTCEIWDGDSDSGDYSEETDTYYTPEGWYETNEYEETHFYIHDPVSHWTPLPPGPDEARAPVEPKPSEASGIPSDDLRRLWNAEVDDADKLLTALGLGDKETISEQYRSEGGFLRVGKIVSALKERGLSHEPGEGRKGPEVAEWPELPSKTNPDILVDERCMDLAKHFLAGGAEILGEPQDCVANRSSLARDIQQAVEDWFLEASLTKEIGHE